MRPYMLSELIKFAQQILLEEGDMIVWAETTVHGYDDNEVHSVPVGYPPEIRVNPNLHGFWEKENYGKAFVVHGSETG